MKIRPPVQAADVGPLRRPRVGFLYIAQAHQVLHSLSVAIHLARSRPDLRVDVLATSQEVLDQARFMAAAMGEAPITWRLAGPAWLRGLRRPGSTPPKLPMLAASARMLGAYDVIVAPERTTAALRPLGVRARLVYTQHGAGDRAGPFEPRLRRFDLVFAAGDKQRDRMLAEGLVAPERCAVVGYPKFDLVDALQPNLPRLWPDDRPVVLYNPHFSAKLGSWARWGPRILQAFAAQRRFNLVFAPHVRLFEGVDPRQVAALAPFVGRPGLHIDLGATSASFDMTYTRAADIYLGDVSSQVYEFLREPRPCLFLNAHGVSWRGDESYRHWSFGPVIDDADDVIAAVTDAQRTHAAYRAAQGDGFRYTFDLSAPGSSARAAEAIANLATPACEPERRPGTMTQEDTAWPTELRPRN